MKKLILCLCAAAGLAGTFATAPVARADNERYSEEEDSGYRPRYRYREDYREDRRYRRREHRRHDHGYDHCRRGQVYIIERGGPVRREVYFDPAGRCFYPAGPRRVYVENYYHEYPRHFHGHGHRHHHSRPRIGLSFGFGG